jgi:hypothetical protein
LVKRGNNACQIDNYQDYPCVIQAGKNIYECFLLCHNNICIGAKLKRRRAFTVNFDGKLACTFQTDLVFSVFLASVDHGVNVFRCTVIQDSAIGKDITAVVSNFVN